MACRSSTNRLADRSVYIYNLPYNERKSVCQILDLNNAWEELGGAYLGFDVNTLYRFKQAVLRNSSPTDEMLRDWGMQNHTVLELFIHLSKMHHYQAMTVLKPFVSDEYHRLIYEGEENPMRLFNCKVDENKKRDFDKDPGDGKSMMYGAYNLDQENKITKTNPSDGEKKIINGPSDSERNSNDEASNPLQVALKGHIPLISYKELEEATGGWDSKNLLGKGGFGTVYKGTWQYIDVAIKKLDIQASRASDEKSQFQNQLLTELRSLNTFRHDNILPLYGFCVGGQNDCLVYQYMPNGSLEDKLLCRDGTRPLSWSDRHSISIGIARGLHFLHTCGTKPLVHGDIKCANILLDPSLSPKIGDFGLAREGPIENYTYIKVSRVHGTKPYLPNEFLRDRKFSTKVDVYSFGIVLFELATGLRAYDGRRKHKFLKDHVESVSDDKIFELSDPKLLPDETISFQALITLGKRSTALKSKNRPEMKYILVELDAMLCTNDINRRIPLILLDSTRPTGQSDLPMTRDRQITASVEPHLPKLHFPIAPPLIESSSQVSESSCTSFSSLEDSSSSPCINQPIGHDDVGINEIPLSVAPSAPPDESPIPKFSVLLN